MCGVGVAVGVIRKVNNGRRVISNGMMIFSGRVNNILTTLDSVGFTNWFTRILEILEEHKVSFVINKNDTSQVELGVYLKKLTSMVYNDL